MRKVGIYLIYAAVALRGLVRLANEPWFGLAAVLLALYGLLLVLAENFLKNRVSSEKPGFWLAIAYLLVQSVLVVGLLFVPPILDYFGLLFIPLSLQAVFFFGRRPGYLYGLAICSAMAVAHHRAIALALLAPFLIALPAFMAGAVLISQHGSGTR